MAALVGRLTRSAVVLFDGSSTRAAWPLERTQMTTDGGIDTRRSVKSACFGWHMACRERRAMWIARTCGRLDGHVQRHGEFMGGGAADLCNRAHGRTVWAAAAIRRGCVFGRTCPVCRRGLVFTTGPAAPGGDFLKRGSLLNFAARVADLFLNSPGSAGTGR